jgi:hypothetical protein
LTKRECQFQQKEVRYSIPGYKQKEVVSKVNEGPENSLNDYLAPSGTRIKRGRIILLIQPLSSFDAQD